MPGTQEDYTLHISETLSFPVLVPEGRKVLRWCLELYVVSHSFWFSVVYSFPLYPFPYI